MLYYKSFILISISSVSILLSNDRKAEDIGTGTRLEQESNTYLGKIGDYGSPNSPLLDRAKGYALDGKKLKKLGWEPKKDVIKRIKQTVNWTINNRDWL